MNILPGLNCHYETTKQEIIQQEVNRPWDMIALLQVKLGFKS
jgi:hypothetical protein